MSPLPSYEQALAALNNRDDKTLKDAVFAFTMEDGYYIEQVIEAVRSLLKRPDLSPRQIVGIGHALHGLARLPLCTPGLDIHISLYEKINNDATSYDLYLSSDRFATESGGFIDSGCGTDSMSGPKFEVERGYHNCDGGMSSPEEWSRIFSEMKFAKLEIEDLSDDKLLAWAHPDGSRFWDWIADHD
jgi:hypothetical protein